MDEGTSIAVVVGGASGIGRAVAAALHEAAERVVVADVHGEGAAAVARALGTRADGLQIDVTDGESVRSGFAAVAELGPMRVAVNCAGINCEAVRLADATEEDFDRTMSVNLKGLWRCLRAEVSAMVGHGGGSIVNIASTAGVVGFAKAAAYVASKHGVVGLTRAAALDHAKHGVRVNAVCPGAVDSPMLAERAQAEPGLLGMMAKSHPIGRLVTVEEVAHAVVWLTRPQAAAITGSVVTVDGRATAI